MSTQALRYALATTSFLTAAAAQIGYTGSVAGIGSLPQERKGEIFGDVLNMTVEIEDATYTEISAAGVQTSTRYLPANKVLVDRKENDNDGSVLDFANGVVTESIVADMIGASAPDIGGEQSGPIGYYTGNAELNPPDLVGWAVARGFPRYSVPESGGVLTAF